MMAEQRAAMIKARTLSDCLRSQIVEKDTKAVHDSWNEVNAPLDKAFPNQPRRPEHVKREENLP